MGGYKQMSKLAIPKKYPEVGDKYNREDGAVFVWNGKEWEKQL